MFVLDMYLQMKKNLVHHLTLLHVVHGKVLHHYNIQLKTINLLYMKWN